MFLITFHALLSFQIYALLAFLIALVKKIIDILLNVEDKNKYFFLVHAERDFMPKYSSQMFEEIIIGIGLTILRNTGFLTGVKH